MELFGSEMPYEINSFSQPVANKLRRIAKVVARRWQASKGKANAAQLLWLGHVNIHRSNFISIGEILDFPAGTQVWETPSKINHNIIAELDVDNPILYRPIEIGIDESSQEEFLVGGRHRMLVFCLICLEAGIKEEQISRIQMPVQKNVAHNASDRTRLVRVSNLARQMNTYEKQQLQIEADGMEMSGEDMFYTTLNLYHRTGNLKHLYLMGALAFERFWSETRKDGREVVDFTGKVVKRITPKTMHGIGRAFMAEACGRLVESGKFNEVANDPDLMEAMLHTGFDMMFDESKSYNYRAYGKSGLPQAAPLFGAKLAEETIEEFYLKEGGTTILPT